MTQPIIEVLANMIINDNITNPNYIYQLCDKYKVNQVDVYRMIQVKRGKKK